MILQIVILFAFFLQSTLCASVSNSDVEATERWLDEHRAEHREALKELLRFPSISAERVRASAVRNAAIWLRNYLKSSGFDNAQLLETSSHPSVYADYLHEPGAPTVLVYGHFDVQPVDPESLWTSAPFTPTIRDSRLYARGATDDKGNMFSVIAAARSWLGAHKKVPVKLKMLFEGAEEIGSPGLKEMLVQNKQLLQADFALSADGAQISRKQPGMCIALRGSSAVQVSVYGAKTDAHSGVFGGGVPNPLHVLAELLAGLHHAQNASVAVQGFYDNVNELTQKDREDIARFPISEQKQLESIGARGEFGEKGFSFYERTWARPTLEIVGMWGGFQGDGIKTVLPREAHAKLSTRLVMRQDPTQISDQIKEHLLRKAKLFSGVNVEVSRLSFQAEPYQMSLDVPANHAVSMVLTNLFGRSPIPFRLGGSIPFFTHAQKVLGIDTTMLGFAYGDENVHAPDEYMELDSIVTAERAYVRIFAQLARMYDSNGSSSNRGSGTDKETKTEL